MLLMIFKRDAIDFPTGDHFDNDDYEREYYESDNDDESEIGRNLTLIGSIYSIVLVITW